MTKKLSLVLLCAILLLAGCDNQFVSTKIESCDSGDRFFKTYLLADYHPNLFNNIYLSPYFFDHPEWDHFNLAVSFITETNGDEVVINSVSIKNTTLIKNVNKRLLANKKISSDHLYGSQVTLFDKIPKEVLVSALDQENYLTVSLIFTIKDNQYSKNFLFRVKETEMAAPLH